MRNIAIVTKLILVFIASCGAIRADAHQSTPKPDSKSQISTQAPGAVAQKHAVVVTPMMEIKNLLDEIDKLLEQRGFSSALAKSDAVTRRAQSAHDIVGGAMALEKTASALDGMHRTEEARMARTAAADIFRGVGGEATNSSQFSDADELYQHALGLDHAVNPNSGEVVADLNALGINSTIAGRAAEAEVYYRRALPIAIQFASRSPELWKTIHNLAVLAEGRNSLQEAFDLYEQSYEISSSMAPGWTGVTQSADDLARVSTKSQDLSAALRWEILALVNDEQAPPPRDKGVVYFLNKLVSMATDLHDLPLAEQFAKQLVNALDKQHADQKLILKSLFILTGAASENTDFGTAIDSLSRILLIQRRTNDNPDDIAITLVSLASTEAAYGEDEVAAAHYIEASKMPCIANDPVRAADISVRIASAAFTRGDSEEALARCHFAIQKLESDPNHPDIIVSALGVEASTYIALAEIEAGLGDAEAAAKSASDARRGIAVGFGALRIRKRMHSKPADIVENLLEVGSGEFFVGAFAAANEYFQEARAALALRSADTSPVLAALLGATVDTYIAMLDAVHHRYKDADKLLASAAGILREYVPFSTTLAAVLINQSVDARHCGDYAKAERTAAEAIHNLELHEGVIDNGDSQMLFREQYSKVFKVQCRALICEKKNGAAFAAVERDRGRALTNALANAGDSGPYSLLPLSIRTRSLQLKQQLHTARETRKGIGPDDRKHEQEYRMSDEALQHIQADYGELVRDAYRQSPRYARMVYPLSIGLDTACKKLDRGTLLLEYEVDEDTTYLFTILNGRLKLHVIPLHRKSLDLNIASLVASLNGAAGAPVSNPARGTRIASTLANTQRNGSSMDAPAARFLYKQLVSPAAGDIKRATRLLICPDTELWRIPFCALITNKDDSNRKYLIQQLPIHSTVSMSVYAQTIQERRRRVVSRYRMLAFGDPNYKLANGKGAIMPPSLAYSPGAPQTAHSAGKGSKTGTIFYRLPASRIQATSVTRLYGSKALYLGRKASRTTVLNKADRAANLHFACHALAENQDQFIALAPEGAGQRYGKLTAKDIESSLSLNANLVTLGACDTATGKMSSTEGIISLTRAFEFAGARSVLATMWTIDMNCSNRLFCGIGAPALKAGQNRSPIEQSFYGQLLGLHGDGKAPHNHVSKDRALQIAQIALITDKSSAYSNPAYWAAFSLQGDWQ